MGKNPIDDLLGGGGKGAKLPKPPTGAGNRIDDLLSGRSSKKKSGGGGGPLGVVKGVLASGPVNTVLKGLDLPRKALLAGIPGAMLADKTARAVGPKKGAAGLAFNTALDIAEDPLTYVSFGTAGTAKTGLKVVAKEVSKEAAERVAKGGMKALTAAERAKVAAKTTPKVMTKLDRGAQGGVKVLGHTAPGLGSRGPVLHGVTEAGSKAKGAFVGSKAGTAFVPRARIEAGISKDVADDVGSLYATARAAKSHGIATREKRLLAAARGTENLSDADLDVLEAALDIGGRGVDVPDRLRPALDVLKAERAASRSAQETHGFLPTFAEAQGKAAAKATKKIDARIAATADRIDTLGPQAERARAFADEVKDRIPQPQQVTGTKRLETAAMRVQAAQTRLRRAQAAAAKADDAITRRALKYAERDLRSAVKETRRGAAERVKADTLDELARQHDTIHRSYNGQIRIPKPGQPGYGEWRAFKTTAGLEARKGRFRNPVIRRQDGSTYRLFSTTGDGLYFGDIGPDELAQQLRLTDDLARQAKMRMGDNGLDHVPDSLRDDPFTDRAVRGSVDDAVRALSDEGLGGAEAEIADVYDRVARAADGEDVALSGKERSLLREVQAEGVTGSAKARLADTRVETVAKLTERGRVAGRNEGVALGKAEQRARILENVKRSAEVRLPKLQAKAAEKGARAAGKVMDPEEYVGRFYSPQGKAFLAKHPEVAAKLGVKPKALAAALDQGGHLKARTLFPDLSAQQIEKKVGAAFREAGMKGPLLDHNPFVNVARSGALADAAIAEKQFLEGVIDLPADVMRRAEKGAKLPHGWKVVDGGPLGKLHAHPAIADEVERVRAVVVNDEAIKEFRGLMGKWHTMWKAQATVPLIGGGGFHLRNAQGNMFNNFLAGVKNPATYARAIVIQNKVRAGRPLTKAERRIVDLAKERGVLDEGFFVNDLMDPAAKGGLLGMVTKEKRGARVRQAANPFSTEGVLTKTGRSVGSAVENNARLAHFIDKLEKLGDADAAARSVKKYLFDYGDLTPFERGVKQWAVPFYTFLRKNTPLQFSNMATQPGKYAAKAHVYNNLAAGRDRDELPTFLQDEPYLPFHVRGQTIAIRPDLPDDAALESVNPIKQSDLGLLGGPLGALGKYLAEEKTGKSLYTGFNTKGSTPQRLAEAALPITGKVRRAPYGPKLPTGAGIGLNSDDPEQQLARLIAALTGLRAYRTDTE